MEEKLERKRIPWQEKEKLKLWLLYSNAVDFLLISKTLGRSKASIHNELKRLSIKKSSTSRRPGPKIRRAEKTWTIQEANQLIASAGLIDCDTSGKIEWTKMPAHTPPWQKKSNFIKENYSLTIQAKKRKSRQLKEIPTFIHFQSVIDGLVEYGHSLECVPKHSTLYAYNMYYVNGALKTPAQMIMMLNEMRKEQGLKDPLLIEGHTWEKA